MLLMVLLGLLPWLLFGGGLLYLGVRAVRALERRGTANAEFAALRERVELLEGTIASQGEEMRRLTDGQHFTERLLADRAGPGRPATDDRPAT